MPVGCQCSKVKLNNFGTPGRKNLCNQRVCQMFLKFVRNLKTYHWKTDRGMKKPNFLPKFQLAAEADADLYQNLS